MLHFILFADDTNIVYSHENIFDLILNVNNELTKLSNWFKANKLSLNVKKTNFMLFGTKQMVLNNNPIYIMFDGIQLERVSNTKFLGVFIDEHLNWKCHIANLSSKISRNLGILRKICYKLSTTTLC